MEMINFKGKQITEDEAVDLVTRMNYGDESITEEMKIDILTELVGMPYEEAVEVAKMF